MAQPVQGKYIQEHTRILHTPTSAVAKGDTVVISGIVGVARDAIAANTEGILQVHGHINAVKVAGAINAGDSLY